MPLRRWRAADLRVAGRELLLWAGAVLGAGCLLLTLVAPAVGLRPLIFLSGSMSPTVPAGSLGLARTVPAADLRVGDVVTVPVSSSYVTHRIVAVEHHDGTALLQLKGDANTSPDTGVYQVASAPRLLGSVPRLGSVVAWFSHAPGVFVLAAYAMFLLSAVRRAWVGRSTGGPSGGAGVGDGSGGTAVEGARPPGLVLRRRVVTAVLVLPWLSLPAAHAAWVDTVSVTGTTLSTATRAATTASCGPLGIGLPTLSWAPVTGATGYRLHYGLGGATVEDVGSGTTSKVLSSLIAGGTFYVEVLYGSWVSPASNSLTYTITLGPLLTLCG